MVEPPERVMPTTMPVPDPIPATTVPLADADGDEPDAGEAKATTKRTKARKDDD